MTEAAAAILHFLPCDKWGTAREMVSITGVTESRCQLILTQFALAGLMIVLTTGSYLVLVLCLQYSVDFSTVPLICYFRCGESPLCGGA
ncbi:hypothetical protein RNH31_005315 [Salmonella enterica]|nr:hypothetical protein [Salmonella enterica]